MFRALLSLAHCTCHKKKQRERTRLRLRHLCSNVDDETSCLLQVKLLESSSLYCCYNGMENKHKQYSNEPLKHNTCRLKLSQPLILLRYWPMETEILLTSLFTFCVIDKRLSQHEKTALLLFKGGVKLL